MLTDQEIIANQVKRISEKTKTNLSARKIHVLWYLCQGENIAPFGSADTGRTEEQMIEYLAGLEDAIDFLSKKENEERGLMRQYRDLKEKHPDAILLFRCGDYYESWNEDAKTCATILGITLTWRDNKGAHNHKTYDGAMAGFPYHALDTYLPKLIRAGKRVAICDQLEYPKPKKKLEKQGITGIVIPGFTNN